eukprot:SAG22_NODE_1905_length_3335_cov_2.377627_3_plen_492_part_00
MQRGQPCWLDCAAPPAGWGLLGAARMATGPAADDMAPVQYWLVGLAEGGTSSAASAAAGDVAPGTATVAIAGQVTKRRILGRKLAFATIQPADGSGAVDVVFKAELFRTAASQSPFPAARSKLHVGDEVRAAVSAHPVGESAERIVYEWSNSGNGGGRAEGRLVSDGTETIDTRLSVEQDICGPWAILGACKSEGCEFRHMFASAHEQAYIQKLRVRKGRALQHAERVAEGRGVAESWSLPTTGKRKLRPKADRAQLFARWLVETYGLERLRSGSGVLDVAGGKGDLASELQNAYSVPCTVVDPAPWTVSGRRRPSNGARPGHNSWRQLCEPFDADFPARHPELFGVEAAAAADDDDDVAAAAAAGGECAAGGREAAAGTARADGVGGAAGPVSIITGLHPDEPTGDIVKVALASGTPFAVAPCCVFTNLFPERKLRGTGQAVRTPDDLVGWLMEQCGDGEARSTRLPFSGRNQVVYTLPREGRDGGDGTT